MSDTTPTILAVGAAGPFARLVVPALAARGARVRGLVRDATEGDAVRRNGAAEVAVGDLTARASVDAALRGGRRCSTSRPRSSPTRRRSGRPWSTPRGGRACGGSCSRR